MRLAWLTILVCLVTFSSSRSQDTAGKNLLQNGNFKADLTGWTFQQKNNAQVESVDATLPAGNETLDQAIRVALTLNEGDQPGSVSLHQPITEPIRINDRVTLKFWARADEPTRIEVFLIQTTAPFSRKMDTLIDIGTQWKEYEVGGVTMQPLDAKTHNLTFHLAFALSAIEMTGLRLTAAPAPGAPASEVGPPMPIAPTTPPDPTTPLINFDFARGVQDWNSSPEATRYTMSLVPLKDSTYTYALRFVTTPRANDRPGKIWLRRAVPIAVKRGDKLQLKVWVRNREAMPIDILMENRRDPQGPKLMQKLKVPLTPEWQEVEVRGIAARDYEAGQLTMVFDLGLKPGVIDFAGMQLNKLI